MAKKIKFPLEMKDGVHVRTIEELKENFDIEKAMEYLLDGKLQIWLSDRYYIQEAEEIGKLDVYATDTKSRLYAILGIEIQQGDEKEVDIEAIEKRKERLMKLKQFTDDESIWDKVDTVAFNQEELANLLDEECKEIYICGNDMRIPLSIPNMKYIGIKRPYVVLSGNGDAAYCRENNIILENLLYERSGVEDGETKYIEYRIKEALEVLIPEAKNGDGRAMWILCNIYTNGGCGVDIDDEKAKEWCIKGKEVNEPLSILGYAILYEQNLEEKISMCQTVKEKIKKMSDKGDMLASNALGVAYLNVTDEEIDYEKSVYYFRRAAEMGFWKAKYSLGLRYMNGEGVEKDLHIAVDYYKEASEYGVGYVNALYRLGECYEYGWGGEKNEEKAHEYWQKASRQYSNKNKEIWYNEIIAKIDEFKKDTCEKMWHSATEATNCDYNLGLLKERYPTEGAARTAGSARIESCAAWLSNTWSGSSKRFTSLINYYVKKTYEIMDYINIRSRRVWGNTALTFSRDLKEMYQSYVEMILNEGNFSYYSTSETVNSIECMDMCYEHDSYLFRKAEWRVMHWKDKYLREQEDSKVEEFSARLYELLKDKIWNQLRRECEINYKNSLI